MVKWFMISFGCWAVLAATFTIWRFLEFDHLLKRLYLANHDEWVKLGMPMGFFWVPKELKLKSFFKPTVSRSALFITLSKAPQTPIDGLSLADYANLRVAGLLGKISLAGALICLCLAFASIFF